MPRPARSRVYASPTVFPRLAQDWLPTRAGSPLVGRDSHPLDDKQSFMEVSHPPIPVDPQGLVAPKTEFGTFLQLSFNRQGYMITAENFIGKRDDKTLYPNTLELFCQRMAAFPDGVVTDLGYRSPKNIKLSQDKLNVVFMGKSEDVDADHQETYLKARSATEGFIAVAKNLRGFGRSLYRGLKGAKIWSSLSQCAYNLHKFLQLHRNEALAEETLMKLRL